MLTIGLLLGASVCLMESYATARAMVGRSNPYHIAGVREHVGMAWLYLASGQAGFFACIVAAFR